MSSKSKGNILVNAAKLATLNILLQVWLKSELFCNRMVEQPDRSISFLTHFSSHSFDCQVGLRASTFIANAVILRYSDKSLLGIINVRLMLLYTTCQFFCREATRRACTSDAKLYRWNVSVNCIWMK